MKSYTHSIFTKLGIPPALALGIFGIYKMLFDQTENAKLVLLLGLAVLIAVFVILVAILYFKTALNTYFLTDDGLMVKSPFKTKVVAWEEIAWVRINNPLKYIRIIDRESKTIVFSSTDAFPGIQDFLNEVYTRSSCNVAQPKFKAFNAVLCVVAILMTATVLILFKDDAELSLNGIRTDGLVTLVKELDPILEIRSGDYKVNYLFEYNDKKIEGSTTVAPTQRPNVGETLNITFSRTNPSLSKLSSQVSLRWISALGISIVLLIYTVTQAIKFVQEPRESQFTETPPTQ